MISWRQQIRLDFVSYVIRVHSNDGNSYEGLLTRVELQGNNDNNNNNHNYIKILESDWSSAGLISAVIGQLHTSCLSNWTVRVIKLALVALEWLFFGM